MKKRVENLNKLKESDAKAKETIKLKRRIQMRLMTDTFCEKFDEFLKKLDSINAEMLRIENEVLEKKSWKHTPKKKTNSEKKNQNKREILQ